MSYRSWYAILTVDGKEYRIGPYPTRRTAERKAAEHFKGASTGDVSVVYEAGPKAVRHGRF